MASTDLDLASQPGQMVGASPSTPDGIPSTIGKLTVSQSGESIILAPQDAAGNPLTVSAVRSSDDIQIVALAGTAKSSSFTLQLAGQTTAPIPLSPFPPMTTFVWAATLPAAGSFDLAFAYGSYGAPPGGQACSEALVEIFDSGTRLGAINLDQTVYPDPTTDIPVPGVGVFKSLGTFTFGSPNLEIHLSGVTGTGTLLAGMIRVIPHGSTDPAAIGYIDPTPNRDAGSDQALEGRTGIVTYGGWVLNFYYTPVGNWHGYYYAYPTGTQPTLFPKVADVQAALQGLSNVTASGFQLSTPSNQQFMIHFTGPLAGQSVATLVSSDPAFAVLHDGTGGSSMGGQYPSVTVNGQLYPLRAASFAPGRPYVMLHLIQDAPDAQYCCCGQGLFQLGGYYPVQCNAGFSGQLATSTTSGVAATWQFQAIPGVAQYQVAITWPGGDANGDLLTCKIQDGLGNTLATVTGIDQSQPPADFQEGGVGWKILGQFTLNGRSNNLTVVGINPGNPNKHVLIDAVRLGRVGSRQSIQIQPTDHVLFSAPAGFVATSSGDLPAVQNLIVTPAGSTRLPAIPTTPKTMKVGVNMDAPTYYGPDPYFANAAVQALVPFGMYLTAAGNPTQLALDGRFGCGAAVTLLTQPPSDTRGNGRGVPTFPNGVWVVQWQGPATNWCQLLSGTDTTSVTEIVAKRSTGTVNRRYYQVAESYFNGPSLSLALVGNEQNPNGLFACNITNVAVYPPDVDPDQTSRWRPSFLAKLKGFNCLRFMDLFATNNMNLSSFAHFPDPVNFPLGYGGRSINIPIASIGPPSADPFAENVAGTVIRVTTTVPHGLTTGFVVQLRSTDGSSLGQVLGGVIDPATRATTATMRDPIDPTDGFNGQVRLNQCHVIDATTIQFGLNVGAGPLARMTNTLTPSHGVLVAYVAPAALMAPSDAADLCATVGAEPWVNVPWLADDDCVRQLALAFANRIPRGTLVHVEYGNEAWNFGFFGFFYSVWMNNLAGAAGVDYVPHYMTRMGQVHQIFRDTWAAAGRDPAEVRRVCGAQYDNAGGTTGVQVKYAVANGISFDEIAPASYYSNVPASGPDDDLLTREQLLDLFAVNIQQSDVVATLTAHSQIVAGYAAQNPTLTWLNDVVLVNYEGGPDTMTTPTIPTNVASLSHGVHRDPDFCQIELHHLQLLQNAGVTLTNLFTLYGTRDLYQWGIYEGAHMVAGTGDATVDVANRTDVENLAAIKSETAAAVNQWRALIKSPLAVIVKLRNQILATFGQEAY